MSTGNTMPDMSEIIKAAKLQQEERNKKTVENRKKPIVNQQPIPQTVNPSELKHGDYVQTEDGVGGIIIDHEEELRKMQENDATGKALLELVHGDSIVTDANDYIPNYGKGAPKGYNPGVEYITNNPDDPKTKSMKDIKKGFAGLTYGLPGHGLVPADSEEGRRVTEALEKLRTGEIILPTPEEYERQKQEALERRKQRNLDKQTNKNIEQQPIDKDPIKEVSMAEMPENAVMRGGVEDLLKAIQ